jgi:acyl-coenzyme A synthetase/AMP-(fatty) acid ligase
MTGIVSSNTVIDSNMQYLWSDLSEAILSQIGDIASTRQRRIIFVANNELEAASLVAAGITTRLDFGVIERSRLNGELASRLAELGITLVDVKSGTRYDDVFEVTNAKPGRICVLTSGTTGLPKLVNHTIESLNTFDRVRNLEPNNWFVPYQIGSYAWYQMLALGLFVERQGLVLGRSGDLMQSFEQALLDGEITAVSSTPTFWRQAAMSINPKVFASSPLKSISLGGEIVDQAILNYLKAIFPSAKIKHIYASSETGAAIVVSDGQAGFDAAILNSSNDRPVAVRLANDRLQIRSSYGNLDANASWIDTGDLVERIGDRIYFRGRADNQMINVGGQKAFPAVIESVLLSHPDVVWAQVVAERSPIIGFLPVANLVLKPDVQPESAEIELSQFCESQLPDYAVPRLWNFLGTIPLHASLKS